MGLFNTAANTSQPDGVDLIETSSKIGFFVRRNRNLFPASRGLSRRGKKRDLC